MAELGRAEGEIFATLTGPGSVSVDRAAVEELMTEALAQVLASIRNGWPEFGGRVGIKVRIIAETTKIEALSDIDNRVYETIRKRGPHWIAFSEICAQTLLSPDSILRSLLVLSERDLMQMNPDSQDIECRVIASY